MRYLMMFLVLVFVGCSNPELEKKQAEERAIKETIGYKLATLSTGNNNLSVVDPVVVKTMDDIKAIHKMTGVSEEGISDMAYYGMKTIREKGVSSNADEVLDALRRLIEENGLNPRGDAKEQIASLITFYIITRTNTDQDHQTAVNSLLTISRAGQKLMNSQ